MLNIQPKIPTIPAVDYLRECLSRYDDSDIYPLPGCKGLIDKALTYSPGATQEMIIDYICEGSELDPTRVSIQEHTENGIVIEKENAGFKTLTELGNYKEGVVNLILNRIRLLLTSSSSPLKEVRQTNYTRAWKNDEGLYDAEEEMIANHKISKSYLKLRNYAKQRIPIILRILNQKSAELNCGLYQLTRAYFDLTVNQGRHPSTLRTSDFYYHGYNLWHVTFKGVYDRYIDGTKDGKQTWAAEAIRYIIGLDNNNKDAAFLMTRELIQLCTQLGINMMDDDPDWFKPDNINKLYIGSVITDEEYFNLYQANNDEVYSWLSKEKLFSPMPKLVVNTVEEGSNFDEYVEDIYETFAQMFNDALKASPKLCVKARHDQAIHFIETVLTERYAMMSQMINNLEFDSYGFLTYQGQVLLMPSTDFSAPQSRLLIHSTGFVVSVNSNFTRVIVTSAANVEKAYFEVKNGNRAPALDWRDLCLRS